MLCNKVPGGGRCRGLSRKKTRRRKREAAEGRKAEASGPSKKSRSSSQDDSAEENGEDKVETDRILETLFGDGAPNLGFEGSEDVPKGGEKVPIPGQLYRDMTLTRFARGVMWKY